jgi:protein-tyrosine phosphatase
MTALLVLPTPIPEPAPAIAIPVTHRSSPRPGPLRRLRSQAGALRRALAALHDSALHPLRRRRARARLRTLPRPRAVLFLCLGNVCRSPYAAHRFQRLAEEAGDAELDVISAGFIGPGRPPADMALAQALERGVDTTAYRSRVVEPAMLEATDLVVLVDAAHGRRLRRALGRHGVPTVVLGDLDPEPVKRRTIRDPWGQDPAVYQRVFDRLDRCLGELAALLFDPDRTRA